MPRVSSVSTSRVVRDDSTGSVYLDTIADFHRKDGLRQYGI